MNRLSWAWIVAVGTLLAAGLDARAALLQYEGFDYNGDGLGAVMDGRAGGLGFDGAWLDSDGDFAIYSDDNTSLHYPSSSPLAGLERGGRLHAVLPGNDGTVVGSADIEGVRDLHASSANDVIGWNKDGVTYVSALVRKSSTSESTFEDIMIGFDNGTTSIGTQFGITHDEHFFAGISTAGISTGTKIASAGTTYLLVAKLESSTTVNDVLSLWVYEEGDLVPISDPLTGFDVTQSVASGRTNERLRIRFGNFNTGVEIDEIRIGDTWASVVAPEPATIGLLALGGLILGRRRRRV
jgi:hypothetical protein